MAARCHYYSGLLRKGRKKQPLIPAGRNPAATLGRLPGSLDLIQELKQAGIKIALGSASKNTPIILERLKLENTFDAIADGNIVSKAKPDPEVFLIAARMLNVNPEECIVIEDAIAGIRAAKTAGMRCIGIGSARRLTEAPYVVSGLNKLDLKLLLKIFNSK